MFQRKLAENTALGLVVFAMCGGFSILFLSGNDFDYVEGNPFAEVVLACLYFVVIVLAVLSYTQTREAASGTLPLAALLLLAWLSATWAQTPDLVLRRSVALTGTTLLGIVLAARLSFAAQRHLLRRIFRIGATLSLACVFVAPQYGKGLDGTWQGIFGQKNGLGAIMALAVLTEWYVPATIFRSKVAKIAWLCLYALLLAKSDSVTAFIGVSMTLAVIPVFRMLHWRCRIPLPILCFVIVLLVAVLMPTIISNLDLVMPLVGRSGDLTGRTELWVDLFPVILKQPFLGYGYSGFWEGASTESSIIYRHIGWKAMYSHNGYLEIVLSLGLCGLLFILLFVGTGIRRALAIAETKESIQDLWPLAFMVFFLIHNLAECTIMWQNKLEWALCVATVLGSDPRVRMALIDADRTDFVSGPFGEYA